MENKKADKIVNTIFTVVAMIVAAIFATKGQTPLVAVGLTIGLAVVVCGITIFGLWLVKIIISSLVKAVSNSLHKKDEVLVTEEHKAPVVETKEEEVKVVEEKYKAPKTPKASKVEEKKSGRRKADKKSSK